MAMDFFEHQAVARRRTGLLVALFAAAVVAIAAGTYLVVAGVLAASSEGPGSPTLWEPALLLPVGLGTLAVVSIGSLYRVASLRSGGSAVADLMGARLVEPGSADPDERRLLNVVEEMAIASGTPVPPVYVLDGEDAINAFAAGYAPGDAVVAVTRGTLEQLDRDELQGVVAHEFSHVLNGDMRLNIRLLGYLYGITLIGTIGWILLRSSGYRRRSSREDGGGQLVLIGIGLWILGGLGTFFARLIQAAVSRQREFLADAASVQFTRNPRGIAGALEKIAGIGSRLDDPRAIEVRHMLFGQGAGNWLGRLGATHPPIVERIRRIDASVALEAGRESAHVAPPRAGGAVSALAGTGASAPRDGGADGAPTPSAVATVGEPLEEHVEHARALITALQGPTGFAAWPAQRLGRSRVQIVVATSGKSAG